MRSCVAGTHVPASSEVSSRLESSRVVSSSLNFKDSQFTTLPGPARVAAQMACPSTLVLLPVLATRFTLCLQMFFAGLRAAARTAWCCALVCTLICAAVPIPTLTCPTSVGQVMVDASFGFSCTFSNAGSVGFGPTISMMFPPEVDSTALSIVQAPLPPRVPITFTFTDTQPCFDQYVFTLSGFLWAVCLCFFFLNCAPSV